MISGGPNNVPVGDRKLQVLVYLPAIPGATKDTAGNLATALLGVSDKFNDS
jgi:hypothetical protein